MALPTDNPPVHRIEIGVRRGLRDPRGEHVARSVREFLHIAVDGIRTRDVYHLQGDLSAAELTRVVAELTDPVLSVAAVDRLEDGPFDMAITVAYMPGVTDPVGKSALVAIEDTLGRDVGDSAAVYTSVLYLLDGADAGQAHRIAAELLANPVIQTARVQTYSEWSESRPDLAVPRIEACERPGVDTVDLSGSDEELERLSREGLLALSLQEMAAIRDHFLEQGQSGRRQQAGLGDLPTDVELECLAQTWSEHCKHKIFNAVIDYHQGDSATETIDSLFDTYIRGTTDTVREQQLERDGRSWLISVFHDNAGVVAFDDQIHLVYKVETHNSPSALDPYGGAMTGIVGVNRDPFGTGRGADLLVNVWGYCFASPFFTGDLPPGLLHPHRIRDGVHRGVIDGGNQSGIPYGRGWEIFDHRFLGKPLVFCGTVGSLPVTIAGTPGEDKAARPGDLIVMVGGRIGADGIHGATFSSAALDEASPAQAVQIGDPITQRMMFDFLLEARQRGLYSAITDNGAGGLSSSVGEMAEKPGGARLDLAAAPLKYSGLAPWEILLSEAQERMTLAVPPEHLAELLALAVEREVEATSLGEFTDDGMLEVTFGDEVVALLEMKFLHESPPMRLTARWQPPTFSEPAERTRDCGVQLLDLLARPNLASAEKKARHYDHEVKALAVIRPWIGVDNDVPAEATVWLARHGSLQGFVLSEGINPFLSDLDTYAMAQTVVDEALRRQLAAGARVDRIAALDNFCWPDPVRSAQTPDGEYKLAQLVRACRGLYDACCGFGIPLISGKDSMKNESVLGGVKISVPPTLLLSAIGQIDDVRQAVTLDLKAEGDALFVLGETREELGGSEYFRALGDAAGLSAESPGTPAPYVGTTAPALDLAVATKLYAAFHQAVRAGLVRSAATPTKGGLALALARSAMAGNLGLELDLDACPGTGEMADDSALFSESNGRFVVTTSSADSGAFEELMRQLPCQRAGRVRGDDRLVVRRAEATVLDVSVGDLKTSFKEGLSHA